MFKIRMLFVLALVFSSCFNNKNIQEDEKSQLFGRWMVSEIKDGSYIELNEDSTFIMLYYMQDQLSDSMKIEGVFSIKSSALIFQYNNMVQENEIIKLSTDSLTLRYNEVNTSYIRNYK